MLVATDVGATAKWYEEHLGFQADLLPDKHPFAFAILFRDSVEIMIRQCSAGGFTRPDGDWHVYVRTIGIHDA